MGQGTPVVLLHSSMSSKLQWFRLMQLLSLKYKVLALDLSGYGDAPPPADKENYCLSREVDYVDAVINSAVFRNEPIHLVGHSFGGAVALRYSYHYINSPRVRSLTLFEPVAFHLLDETDEAKISARSIASGVLELVQQGDYSKAAEYFIDHWNGSGTFAAFPTEVKTVLTAGAKKIPLDYQALFNDPARIADYAELTVPVCIMAGGESIPQAHAVARLLGNKLPNAQLKWVHGGHMAPINEAVAVNTIIEDFLRKNNGK